jgi:cytochrome c553
MTHADVSTTDVKEAHSQTIEPIQTEMERIESLLQEEKELMKNLQAIEAEEKKNKAKKQRVMELLDEKKSEKKRILSKG